MDTWYHGTYDKLSSHLELDIVITEGKQAVTAVKQQTHRHHRGTCLQLPFTVTCETYMAFRVLALRSWKMKVGLTADDNRS